jgi:hypothetical protein
VQHDAVVPRIYVLRSDAGPFVDRGLPIEMHDESRTRSSNLGAIREFVGAALAKVVAEDLTAAVEAAKVLARRAG